MIEILNEVESRANERGRLYVEFDSERNFVISFIPQFLFPFHFRIKKNEKRFLFRFSNENGGE